ncbi:MAG: ASPIC/UnbV domain-containing protein, partial [Planctomycetes bacterium]|nr:ASPIC/UnbV domain-containing protein [Planctomycetota bacterium]
PKEQHFGLGRAGSVNLTVVWPNGDTQTIKELGVNAAYVLHQGQDRCIRVDR